MAVNTSKKNDLRMWARWARSGAIGPREGKLRLSGIELNRIGEERDFLRSIIRSDSGLNEGPIIIIRGKKGQWTGHELF